MTDLNSTVGVDVFVRKGSAPGTRIISFRRPDGHQIPEKEWLAKGFAFDGNSLVVEVSPKTAVHYYSPNNGAIDPSVTLPPSVSEQVENLDGCFFFFDSGEEKTLTARLNEVQNALVNWLGSLGYRLFFM